MRAFDRAILVIYSVILVVGVAYGVTISVISIHLSDRGFEKTSLGALASVFALGIVLLSLPSGWVVKRFTPKRTLLGCLLGYTVCLVLFPRLSTFAGVGTVRFFDGAFSVGVWVSCETILLFHAKRAHKAFVMSLYAMALAFGYVLGPIISHFLVPLTSTNAAFYVGAVLAFGAAMIAGFGLPLEHIDDDSKAAPSEESDEPAEIAGIINMPPHEALEPREPLEPREVAAALDSHAPLETTPLSIVLLRIRTSCFATFAYGYFQASVVIFLPLFLIEEKHIPVEKTIYVTAFFALGMLLFSSLAGMIGDRRGHLLVMRTLAFVGAAMVASFVLVEKFSWMCTGVFIAGATLASISPVSLALQGVVTKPRDLSRANAFYNACYAAGMLVGPPISSVLFQKYGGTVMLYHLSGLFFAFAVFAWICKADDPANPKHPAYKTRVAPVAAAAPASGIEL